MPDGDLILALTAGEESGGDYNGVVWLLKEHRELIDARYCINMDAGDPQIQKGRRITRTVQASEKVVQSLRAGSDEPRGPQLAAHSGQPDLPSGRGARSPGRLTTSPCG